MRPYTEARYPSARPPAGMFPDNVRLAPSAHHALARPTAKPSGTRGHWCGEHPSAERDGLAVVAAGGGQRGTLYDSFELNAMVLRLNRLLNGEGAGGSGEARRPRKGAGGGWLAAPKVLFRKIKCAFLGGGRRGGGW